MPPRRHTVTSGVFLQLSVFAFLAPEALLYFAVNERIRAGILLKRAFKLHPHLAKPGLLARMYNYFCGRAKSKHVST